MNKQQQNRPHTWVIVAAAGAGVRFGGAVPKQFASVSGRTLLARTVEVLDRCPGIDGLIVVLPASASSGAGEAPEGLAERDDVCIVTGGARRIDSVRAGLEAVPEACDVVLVHDGVRPAVSPALVQRVTEGAFRDGACVPVLPAADTVKELAADGRVARTLDRDRLRLSQTPQGFRRRVLADAFQWARENGRGDEFTDDAALVEASGHPVGTVEGDPGNLKVTVPGDVARLGLVPPRVGFGYDVHRLEAGRRLVLGGVEIPHDHGLLGHSDADVLLHALGDALLGAAGLGDLGAHFPDDDPAYAGADSLALLRQVVAKVRESGYRASSCDATLVAQAPRLAPYVPDMARNVAEALGLRPSDVGIKATTEEGLGFTGGGEGMAAYAVAMLVAHMD